MPPVSVTTIQRHLPDQSTQKKSSQSFSKSTTFWIGRMMAESVTSAIKSTKKVAWTSPLATPRTQCIVTSTLSSSWPPSHFHWCDRTSTTISARQTSLMGILCQRLILQNSSWVNRSSNDLLQKEDWLVIFREVNPVQPQLKLSVYLLPWLVALKPRREKKPAAIAPDKEPRLTHAPASCKRANYDNFLYLSDETAICAIS